MFILFTIYTVWYSKIDNLIPIKSNVYEDEIHNCQSRELDQYLNGRQPRNSKYNKQSKACMLD